MFWRKAKPYPYAVTDWLSRVSRNEWVVTHNTSVNTAVGAVTIPELFETDLFSAVPDTNHPEFWLASVAHDFMRRSDEWNRVEADIAFGYIMQDAAVTVRERLLAGNKSERTANDECIRLMRVASLYLLGVSGLIGSGYIGLGKLHDKLAFWR